MLCRAVTEEVLFTAGKEMLGRLLREWTVIICAVRGGFVRIVNWPDE